MSGWTGKVKRALMMSMMMMMMKVMMMMGMAQAV